MLIGIQPDKIGRQSYSEKWAEFLEKLNVSYEYIDLINLKTVTKLKKYDGIMWRWGLAYPDRLVAPKILDIIEKKLRIPVYPDSNMRWPWEDKIKQLFLLKTYQIKSPDTWVFWEKEDAFNWIQETDFPKVFKLSVGAGANNVTLLNNATEAYRLVSKLFSTGVSTIEKLEEIKSGNIVNPILRNIKGKFIKRDTSDYRNQQAILEKGYAYFQDFIANNRYDTRVTVIGNRAFAFRRYNRDNDFRASGSGKIDFNKDGISENIIRHAFLISDKLKVNCMAYDFVNNSNDEILLLEMCWTFADWAVHKCPGHWDRDMNWINGQLWPEEAQVKDFVNKIIYDQKNK
jgi:glutathione synthase/RimK-type ligase-like ATP-grasp enzyme